MLIDVISRLRSLLDDEGRRDDGRGGRERDSYIDC